MFYPTVEENGNTRETISQWLGYNHNYYTSDGEFYDMENLSSDNYPLISARAVRPALINADNDIKGAVYTDSGFVYLCDAILHFCTWDMDGVMTDETVDLSSYIEDTNVEQTLLKYGGYILLFPAAISVNIFTKVTETLATTFTMPSTASKVYVEYCNSSGISLTTGHKFTASATAPASPSEGDYWLYTGTNTLECYDADTAMWLPVETVYIQFTFQDSSGTAVDVGLTNVFKEGEAVYMNTGIDDIDNGSIIQTGLTDHSFIVIGLLPNKTSMTLTTLTMERRVPAMDRVCTSSNRVWGCRYEVKDGELTNEIYACALGNPRNWYA